MALAGKYFRLQRNDQSQESHDVDLEDNASDTTKTSSTADIFDKTAFLSLRDDTDASTPSFAHRFLERAKMTSNVWTWLRWGTVVGLQTIMILLLCLKQGGSRDPTKDLNGLAAGGQFVETGGDINGLYKTLSHTYTYLKPEEDKFIPNMTSNDNRMEIRRNWDLLMPLGSGSVLIPDYKNHPLLGNPITDDPIRSGPLFEASWTHALHCLYYSVDSYHQLILYGPSEEDNPMHAAHCFEYLRNSILCNLDMTLEGSMSTPDDKERGQPHVCRNREEAIAWIEARRMDDAQDIVGP
ncbi:hypothetical protein V8C26DRAFT_131422 [Trichoderma gracile]